MSKKLFIIVADGGDGSYYPRYTMDAELVERISRLVDNDVLDYDSGLTDGDGFHYSTVTIPDECTPESLGVSMMDSDYYLQLELRHLGEDDEDDE